MSFPPRRAIVSALVIAGFAVAGFAVGGLIGSVTDRPSDVDRATTVSAPKPAQRDAQTTAPAPTPTTSRSATVLVVSVDGLNPVALRRLGPERAPTLHRLLREGAATLDARTEREQTNTLPNHTGMVTGLRIDASRGGHGVTWNDERPTPATVQEAAGRPVPSVFSALEKAGRSAALFASKEKFGLFHRSWPAGIDRFVVQLDNEGLVAKVRADLVQEERALRFVHLSEPDVVGHEHGFMSARYLTAVADVDALLAGLLTTIEADADLARGLTLVLTSDHGGEGPSHRDPTAPSSFRVPFVVWGAGVTPGTDLYELNGDYREPGARRSTYAWERQPVRNGAVANLTLDLLGMPALRGSEHDAEQDLDVAGAAS